MKNYLLIGAFWVFGLLVGSIWHQSELSLSRAETARLKQELASKTRRSLIPDMTRMMALPETRVARSAPEKVADVPPERNVSDAGPKTPAHRRTDGPFSRRDDQDAFARQMAETLENAESSDEAFEKVADLWRTRRDLAMSALVDNLGLSPSEVQDLEMVLADMNNHLADRFADMADRFQDMPEEPSPEDAFRIVHDFSGVFVETYDTLDDTFHTGWRDDSSGTVDLTAFIDPEIFRPMMDMEWNVQ